MSNDQIRLNTRDRSDDQMMEIDLIPSDGRASHYAIASVVVRMDGMISDSQDLVSFAERLVSRYNACAGMKDPAAEIAELKRQRDELLALAERLVQWDLDYPVNCYNGYAGLQALNAIIRDNKVAITKGSLS